MLRRGDARFLKSGARIQGEKDGERTREKERESGSGDREAENTREPTTRRKGVRRGLNH